VGRVVFDLVPPSSSPNLRQEVGRWFAAAEGAIRSHPLDIEGCRLDGTTFPVHVMLARIETAGGRMAIATVVDLTERAGLEARLRQSARLEVLGQFAGILAHDVRNYLATVSWSAELLADTLEAEHPARQDVELIQQAARDGIAMTRSVLEFARPSGDARGSTDTEAHLEQTRTMLERVLGDAVRLEVTVAPGLPPAGINAAALTQVLVNLATNARDAMPAGGLLRVRADLHESRGNADGAGLEPGRYVRLVVSDTGTGMDEATRRRAFDAFYTTKAGASTTEGTGLGLASVYLIVSRTGGAIRVDSIPGTGTTFTVDIPVA
jgi:signal transduction histidine kinase